MRITLNGATNKAEQIAFSLRQFIYNRIEMLEMVVVTAEFSNRFE